MEPEETDPIRELELAKYRADKKIEEISDKMHAIERAYAAEVEAEAEGKAKNTALSNAQKRALEVSARVAADPEYPALDTHRRQLTGTIALLRIDIDYLRRKHQLKVASVLSRLVDAGIGMVAQEPTDPPQ